MPRRSRVGRARRPCAQARGAGDRPDRAGDREIDNSDGHCGALLERARDIHLAASRAARPDPVQLARDLFARETEVATDTFYRRRAALRRRARRGRARGISPSRHRGLGEAARTRRARRDTRRILRRAPPSDGDPRLLRRARRRRRGRIALRAKDLSSPWSYLQLAEFCLAQGREEEALRRAEEGLWVFEDGRPDERLVFFTVDLLAKAGRKKDAEAHLWRAFEKAPSLELYARLRKLGGKAARERARQFLEARLVTEKRYAVAITRRSSHPYPDAGEDVRRGLGGRTQARGFDGSEGSARRASEATPSARGARSLCGAGRTARQRRRQSGLCGGGGADRAHGGPARRRPNRRLISPALKERHGASAIS